MNTTRVQIGNGNLLCIEGGNAEQVANIIAERHALALNRDEEPLVMPALNFGKEQVAGNAQGDEETPLAMPSMA